MMKMKPQTTYESTNPILYSTSSSSSNVMVSNVNNEDMPNMKALSINSPTSTPLTPPTPPTGVINSKLDSLSGIAAATAVLRQRKHVRNSPRTRKSTLTSGAGSPGGNHYPYTTTVGSSRHRLLAPVTPQPPPSHPISTAILRRNRIQNGIKNVVRGVSDSLFTHNNERQSNLNFTRHHIFGNLSNNLPFPRCNQNTSVDQTSSNSQPTTDAQSTPSTQSSTSQQQQQPSMPEVNLNQDDVNHGIKCCLQWLKYAISHLDQEINLLRNIANESFHIYCNNIQNRRNNTNSNNVDNKDNSNIESDYYNSTSQDLESSSSSTSENSNQRCRLLPQFQLGSNQVTNYHRKSLIEIKRDIVFTIRKTVEIIIKGASKYLPDESRIVIRRFILSLPSRLSKLTQKPNVPETIKSTDAATSDAATSTANDKIKDANANASSVSSSVTTDNVGEEKDDHIKSTKEESLKIMTLATEGNDMLKKMMDVFEKSFQENNKNNLDNINLINTNEGSSLNYNTNKIFYNPMGTNNNNNKFNKMNNITNQTATTTTNTNSNYVINDSMNCEESQPINTN